MIEKQYMSSGIFKTSQVKLWKILDISMIIALTINTLFPLDKLCLPVFLLAFINKGLRLSTLQIQICCCFFVVSFFSFIVNFPNSNMEIFYPVAFLMGAFVFFKSRFNLLLVRKLLFINVLFGLAFAVLASLGIDNPYARTLLEKGLPFIFAPLGFSPTNQVFGTFCILVLMISFEYKKFDILFFITLLSLFLTMNRCSILFFFLLCFFYERKVFYFFAFFVFCSLFVFWNEIELFFSTSTLDSRDELRKGVELAFWRSNDMWVYLAGMGNSHVSNIFTAKTLWERSYIENGLDFVVHCYGFIGFISLLILVICFCCKLVQNKQWRFLLFFMYYILFEQWMTHEFLSSSLMFFLGILLSLVFNQNNNQRYGKIVNNHRYIQCVQNA